MSNFDYEINPRSNLSFKVLALINVVCIWEIVKNGLKKKIPSLYNCWPIFSQTAYRKSIHSFLKIIFRWVISPLQLISDWRSSYHSKRPDSGKNFHFWLLLAIIKMAFRPSILHNFNICLTVSTYVRKFKLSSFENFTFRSICNSYRQFLVCFFPDIM